MEAMTAIVGILAGAILLELDGRTRINAVQWKYNETLTEIGQWRAFGVMIKRMLPQ